MPPLQVHVTGAVKNPGVYELPDGAIVAEALEAAGGASRGAALERVNLAKEVADGDPVLMVNRVRLTQPANPSAGSTDPSRGSELLSLNVANEPELEQLPGIGASLAQASVRYRLEHGPFQAVDELTNVPGIGPAKLAAIRELVPIP